MSGEIDRISTYSNKNAAGGRGGGGRGEIDGIQFLIISQKKAKNNEKEGGHNIVVLTIRLSHYKK